MKDVYLSNLSYTLAADTFTEVEFLSRKNNVKVVNIELTIQKDAIQKPNIVHTSLNEEYQIKCELEDDTVKIYFYSKNIRKEKLEAKLMLSNIEPKTTEEFLEKFLEHVIN